ncbi:O-antigen ligase family protein [Phenylobacterium sp. LH3H17]|uniref:O-antigen ligase family protein n=1 Tax=Phenylobacterium sp. LH3H17 TaxID=2903901 RepID=UPI0020C9F4CF|nr:O-antigen ligase [Phenylobacterium sp. LH3H17]UTP40087.1 O-antigen ligase family protein [Phenylobacterium sp. LH3H17]
MISPDQLAEPYERLTVVRLIEASLTVLVVALMSSALIGPLFDPLQTGGDEVPILRVMWLPVYALIAALAAFRLPQLFRFWGPALAFLVLVGWAGASVMWSIEPDVTLRRAIALAATTLMGLYLASSLGGRRFAELVALTMLLLALGSYFVCLAVPKMGVSQDINAGTWRGLWYEKNEMGAMMVYASLAAVAAFLTNPRRRLLWGGALVLFIGLIIMTRSATSFLSLLIVLGGATVFAFMRLGRAASVVAIWLGVTGMSALAGLYLFAPTLFYAALGKDATFTGRTDIWNAVLRAHEAEPVLGYGYAAFWGRQSDIANWIRDALQWRVPSAHNGWLDLLIQLGLVGVGIFAAIFAISLLTAVVRHQRLGDGYWATLFLAVYSLQTMSESIILVHNNLSWVFAVAAMARILGPKPATAGAAAHRPAVTARPMTWTPAHA